MGGVDRLRYVLKSLKNVVILLFEAVLRFGIKQRERHDLLGFLQIATLKVNVGDVVSHVIFVAFEAIVKRLLARRFHFDARFPPVRENQPGGLIAPLDRG